MSSSERCARWCCLCACDKTDADNPHKRMAIRVPSADCATCVFNESMTTPHEDDDMAVAGTVAGIPIATFCISPTL